MKQEPKAKLRGKVEIRKLSEFRCNDWNPNRMTDAMRASLEHGLVHDGWLVSQALLIWGTDETGAKKNMIIDGEHRYRCALDLGIASGPVVVLDKITEAEAKALTIKMNQKRGEFDTIELATLVQSISGALEPSGLAVDLGFSEAEVSKLLATAAIPAIPATPATTEPSSAPADTTKPPSTPTAPEQQRTISVVLSPEDHAVFVERCAMLGQAWGTSTMGETIAHAVKFSAEYVGNDETTGRDEQASATEELADFDPEADDE